MKLVSESLKEFYPGKSGFVQLVRSEDSHGYSDTDVIPFSSGDELISILKRSGAVETDGVIVYKSEDDSYHGFPVDKWVEFVLDSIYGGMNGFMGNANDVYPFLYEGGWYGWVSKDERPDDLAEAKRRFHGR